MYNEALGQAILKTLDHTFPTKSDLKGLKSAVPEFAALSNEEWLLAIDALHKDGLVTGLLPRAGLDQVLVAVANLEITTVGRQQVREFRVQVEDSLRHESADLDPLLQIYNRGRFDADLGKMVDLANSEQPLSLVMIDLDHFKKVNDTYGHPVGDEALKRVATLLKAASNARGSCYRYGGEEFAVLLPNHTPDEATTLAERIRTTVCADTFQPVPHPITVSLGVATIPYHAHDADNLKSQSDSALYQAKRLGRNLVRVAGESEAVPRPARVVKRRPPDPEGLSDEERAEIRESYFRTHQAKCPRDQAILNVRVSQVLERKTADLIVNCPLCGLQAILGAG